MKPEITFRKWAAGLLPALMAAAAMLFTSIPAKAAHSLPDSSFTEVPGTDISYSPSVSADEAYFATTLYLQIPENIRSRLAHDNVQIYLIAKKDDSITTSKLKTVSENGKKITFVGLTTHPVYQVYTDSETGETEVLRCSDGMIEIQTDIPNVKPDQTRIIHEIGHYVDSAAGSTTGEDFAVSTSEEWQNLYQKYSDALLETSAYQKVPDLYSASEAWADAFRLLFTDPAALEDISEDLFQYVAQVSFQLPVDGGDIAVTQ